MSTATVVFHHIKDVLTLSRYLLRRAAVRAISQPSRHLSTFRPTTTRVTFRQPSKPVIYRSLHQTRIWLADEQRTQREEASPADVETTGETVPPQGTKENIEAGEIADAATKEASQAARDANQDAILESSAATGELPAQESQAVTEEMQDQFVDDAATAGRAAETASAAAASTQASSSQPPRQSQSAMFPNAGSSTPAGPRGESRPNRILYIGNLFFEVTAAQLEQEFQRFGEVTNSRVVTDSRGLSKGFAYIEFARQESADQAIRELDQRVFQGRRMAVQYHVRREPKRFSGANDKAPNAPSKTLFIGNMSYQMSDRDLNGEYYHSAND